MKVVAYTTVFGGYDSLQDTDFPCVCLTDDPTQITPKGNWRIRRVPTRHTNLRRASRHPKMLPHIYFPEAECTLYIDGNIQLLTNPEELVSEFLQCYDLALFPHPQRTCIYEEADACIRLNKADPEEISRQVAAYRKVGFPSWFGLTACWVILRRNTSKVQRMGKLWWKEYLRYSERDQMSFDYVRWRLGFEYARLPGNLFRNTSKHFRKVSHK